MNIFVSNVPYTATETKVRQLFEGYGPVDTVRPDFDTNKYI